MTGILLLIVVGFWLWACVAVTRVLMRRLKSPLLRPLFGIVVFVALLITPVADEIVGGFQFRALCEKNAVFHVGVNNPEGRATRYASNPLEETISGFLTIYHTGVEYTDTQSGELVLKFHRYEVKGGLLIRLLGVSEGNYPILIGRASCSPEQVRGEVASRTFKFSVVN